MKKMIALTMVFVAVLVLSASVSADPVGKLKSGLTDIIKSPMEVVDHTKAEFKASTFKPFGLVGGLVKGTFYMGKKALGGAMDVVTFPIK